MASRSNNNSRGIKEAQGEYPLVPNMLSERRMKLLNDAQWAAMGPSRQRSGQYVPAAGEITNMRHKAHVGRHERNRQVLMANNLKMLAHRVGEISS